jgi:hypothetical protein
MSEISQIPIFLPEFNPEVNSVGKDESLLLPVRDYFIDIHDAPPFDWVVESVLSSSIYISTLDATSD